MSLDVRNRSNLNKTLALLYSDIRYRVIITLIFKVTARMQLYSIQMDTEEHGYCTRSLFFKNNELIIPFTRLNRKIFLLQTKAILQQLLTFTKSPTFQTINLWATFNEKKCWNISRWNHILVSFYLFTFKTYLRIIREQRCATPVWFVSKEFQESRQR